MKRLGVNWLSLTMLAALALPLHAANQSEVDAWEAFLKPKYFGDTELLDGSSVFELITPYRAEDAALTPVSITAKIPQTEERYIESYLLLVDKNPQPLVGTFHMTPAMGRADLAMRVRINEYTNFRAVARMNTGEHYLVTNFVKAQGGCSAPPAGDLQAAMNRMGRMKFRTVEEGADAGFALGQFKLSHPNITGMQLDQRTRAYIPEHYVKTITLTFNDQEVMRADVGFSVSEDPTFRFFFKPETGGTMKAYVVDSKGLEFSEEFEVKI